MIKVSETLNEAIKNFLNFSPSVVSHMENRENPHGVTKEQVGLSEIENVKHTTKAEFDAHISGAADKHSGNDIMYSEGKSVNEKINEIIIDGGGGTMYHNEMLNRSSENAHPIEAITGLRDEMGTTLVFEAVTTDASDTALECSDTDSEFINESGYIVMPENTIAKIDVVVIGVQCGSGGGINPVAGGIWSTKGIAFRVGSGNVSTFKTDEMDVIRMKPDETGTSAFMMSGTGLRSFYINVKGLADTEMHWRAEVKITNVINFD